MKKPSKHALMKINCINAKMLPTLPRDNNSWLDAATHGARLGSSSHCAQAHLCRVQNGNHFSISGGEKMNSGPGRPLAKVLGN